MAGVALANATMASTSKSLQDQVREIRKLIEDAEASLAQAEWALQTLEFRLGQGEGDGAGSDD